MLNSPVTSCISDKIDNSSKNVDSIMMNKLINNIIIKCLTLYLINILVHIFNLYINIILVCDGKILMTNSI